MKIELTGSTADWIAAEVAAGHFTSPEDVVSDAINKAKLAALRETVDASIARGGTNSAEQVLEYVKSHLATNAHAKQPS